MSMSMTLTKAKTIIRQALAEATPEKLCELLDAARNEYMPYSRSRGESIKSCGCLAERCIGRWEERRGYIWGENELSRAYWALAPLALAPFLDLTDRAACDLRRQRILVAMVKAEMKRRAIPIATSATPIEQVKEGVTV
jgi:hypothetical protein